MNLHLTGGPTTPAEATWIKTLFGVARTKKGTPEERLASLNEENAWAAVKREKEHHRGARDLVTKAAR